MNPEGFIKWKNPCSEVYLPTLMHQHSKITFDSLLERLGGRELLELMINASNFAPIYSTTLGLRFEFKVAEQDNPRMVSFIPMAYNAYNAPVPYNLEREYELRMVLEERDGQAWKMRKSHHAVVITRFENLIETFETMTHLTLSF
jgi:hypothetical protein